MESEAPSMENPKISAYYQTRLAHFGVVSTE
ncbi:translation initiation factor eIF-2B subunit alpha, partial [Trifolium medium]|nr:translation initiation factor eIF-2B subunit alpha [Trifolium medium]